MNVISYQPPMPEMVNALEQQLFFSLRPVQPNQEFVNHLQQRLTSPPTMTVDRDYKAISLLLIAASLFSGTLVLLLLRHFRSS